RRVPVAGRTWTAAPGTGVTCPVGSLSWAVMGSSLPPAAGLTGPDASWAPPTPRARSAHDGSRAAASGQHGVDLRGERGLGPRADDLLHEPAVLVDVQRPARRGAVRRRRLPVGGGGAAGGLHPALVGLRPRPE